jgi:thiol-disulfide isomerase/thioredoxin
VAPPTTLALVSAVLLAALLAGCSGQRGLEQTYGDVAEQDYFSSDGAFSFVAAANRQGSLQFSGELDIEGSWDSADFLGQPIVVNFWFAGCPPCRLEAEDLEALHQDFQADGVQFIGVNILDGPETARSFADEFGVTYPSLIDANSGLVRLSFAGEASPNAVPTTLVLDRQHRVAARVNGLITDVDLLETMITDVLAEAP